MSDNAELHPDIAKHVADGKLPAAAAPKVSQLAPGTFVSSRNFGAGKIAEWDLLGDRMLVDFEGKPGHALKLEFASKLLDIIGEDHILARRFADKAGLLDLAEKDPAGFVRLALVSNGRKMSFDAFEDLVKGKIIPEGKFKNWWENAKKVLRTKPQFIVPPKRTLPLELRGDDISPTDALLEDFRGAREMKAKIKAIEAILKEPSIFGSNPAETLLPIAKEAEETISQNLRLKPAEAIEMLLTRDDLVERVEGLREHVSLTLAKAMEEIYERLPEFVTTLTPTKQFRVFNALPEAMGEGWADQATALINKLPQRSIAELAKVYVKRDSVDKLLTFLKTTIGHRALGSEALAWVCRERATITKPVFSAEITAALMGAIERDHFDDDKRSNRVMDVLMSDKDIIADVLANAEPNQVNNFSRQVLLSPAFDELTKRSLMARIIKVVPEVEELILEHKKDDEDDGPQTALIVSWTSLETQKAAHKQLTEIEIPKNREDIIIAREYGDLRENFEYKSAKEFQRVLMRRKMEMERDLARAQGTDFSDVDPSKVGPGTIVTMEDLADGKQNTYTLLGAWDGDPAKHILSYLTAIGQALQGKSVGDTAELPTETDALRPVKIISITKWAS
jgi:transcription elongation GreA/GreB family factor